MVKIPLCSCSPSPGLLALAKFLCPEVFKRKHPPGTDIAGLVAAKITTVIHAFLVFKTKALRSKGINVGSGQQRYRMGNGHQRSMLLKVAGKAGNHKVTCAVMNISDFKAIEVLAWIDVQNKNMDSYNRLSWQNRFVIVMDDGRQYFRIGLNGAPGQYEKLEERVPDLTIFNLAHFYI